MQNIFSPFSMRIVRYATLRIEENNNKKTETEEKNGIYESMNVMMCVHRSAPFCPSHIMM